MYSGDYIAEANNFDVELDYRAREVAERMIDELTISEHLAYIALMIEQEPMTNDEWLTMMRLVGRSI